MSIALWIVGEPGVGKTALARLFVEPGSVLIPRPKWTVGMQTALVGHYSGSPFDGGDTVPPNDIRPALNYLADVMKPGIGSTVIFDGDKFANLNAYAFLRSMNGFQLRCIHLSCDPALSQARRHSRSTKIQNAPWVLGRRTKADRFSFIFPAGTCLRLDTHHSLDYLHTKVKDWLRT